MKIRDLPEVVKATFGVGSQQDVKVLTSAMLLPTKHTLYCPVPNSPSADGRTHSILRGASQNYYFKSLIPDPDPSLSGGLGQQ
jgi:hypothetical protein